MGYFSHTKARKDPGLVRDKVVSFLSVKFASLEHIFAEPKRIEAYRDGFFDATKFGLVFMSQIILFLFANESLKSNCHVAPEQLQSRARSDPEDSNIP